MNCLHCRSSGRSTGSVEQLQYSCDGTETAVQSHESRKGQMAAPLCEIIARLTSDAPEKRTRSLYHIPREQR